MIAAAQPWVAHAQPVIVRDRPEIVPIQPLVAHARSLVRLSPIDFLLAQPEIPLNPTKIVHAKPEFQLGRAAFPVGRKENRALETAGRLGADSIRGDAISVVTRRIVGWAGEGWVVPARISVALASRWGQAGREGGRLPQIRPGGTTNAASAPASPRAASRQPTRNATGR